MLETDYLIIGAGALSLTFADTLTRHSDATVTIADRNLLPGGHWNFAYDFVRLHQPSEFYGIESVPLGTGEKDTQGWNAGYYQLASGAEVIDYLHAVMTDHLIPSGQVRFLPHTNYLGQGKLKSLDSGHEINLHVRRKVVDATYFGTSIPSQHVPSFQHDPSVRLISPNELSHVLSAGSAPETESICILGAGKTAMDVGVYLLENGIPADQITWVKPRDSWLMNRAALQPGDEFFERTMQAQTAQMRAFAEAESAEDLFRRLEADNVMLRIFPDSTPSMFHCAIISQGETALLRQIRSVIRHGRVRAITRLGLEFDRARISLPGNTLYIDCTASAVARHPKVDIFGKDVITLQIARACQPTFSAALIGLIETLDLPDDEKNRICRPLKLPDSLEDYFSIMLTNLMNQYDWMRTPAIRAWMQGSRLDGFTGRLSAVTEQDETVHAILQAFRNHTPNAIANIQRLMQSADRLAAS